MGRGQVTIDEVRAAARNVVNLLVRTGAMDDGALIEAPSPDHAQDRLLIRTVGAASMVLLRNEIVGRHRRSRYGTIELTSIAVIGPNAHAARVMGGGSA